MTGGLKTALHRRAIAAIAVAAALAVVSGCGDDDSTDDASSEESAAAIPSSDEGIERAAAAWCDSQDASGYADPDVAIVDFVASEYEVAPESVKEALADKDLDVDDVIDNAGLELADDLGVHTGDLRDWLDYLSNSMNEAAKPHVEQYSGGPDPC